MRHSSVCSHIQLAEGSTSSTAAEGLFQGPGSSEFHKAQRPLQENFQACCLFILRRLQVF